MTSRPVDQRSRQPVRSLGSMHLCRDVSDRRKDRDKIELALPVLACFGFEHEASAACVAACS